MNSRYFTIAVVLFIIYGFVTLEDGKKKYRENQEEQSLNYQGSYLDQPGYVELEQFKVVPKEEEKPGFFEKQSEKLINTLNQTELGEAIIDTVVEKAVRRELAGRDV